MLLENINIFNIIIILNFKEKHANGSHLLIMITDIAGTTVNTTVYLNIITVYSNLRYALKKWQNIREIKKLQLEYL